MKISSFFKPLSFIPALLLMYMIYSFSSQAGPESLSASSMVSRKVVQGYSVVSHQGWDDWQIQEKADQINPYVRKGAHMTEYFLLAIAVSFPLYVYGVRGILLMLLAGLICVGYACGDEYHQSFVAGRSPSPRDVGIDSIGIFIGILLVRIFGWSARVSVAGPRIARRQRQQQEELDRREEELAYRERILEERERRDRQFKTPFENGDAPTRVYDPDELRNRETGESQIPRDYCEDGLYREEQEEDSSDELADDIPLFRRRKH